MRQKQLETLIEQETHEHLPATLHHHPGNPEPRRRDQRGCGGRLWQSLILARWSPLLADIRVESLIFEHQAEYYQALQESTRQTDSAPLIAFMLRMILGTVTAYTPQVAPQVTPQVGELLAAIRGEMTRETLRHSLQIVNRIDNLQKNL